MPIEINKSFEKLVSKKFEEKFSQKMQIQLDTTFFSKQIDQKIDEQTNILQQQVNSNNEKVKILV